MPARISRVIRSAWWLIALLVAIPVALPALSRGLAPTGSAELSANGEPSKASTVSSAPALIYERSFHSDALGRDMPYTVFVPPGDRSGQHYPVLYMLHGIGGDHATEWPGYGLLDRAGVLMARGELRPFIIVLPEGEDGYWVDHVGGPAWGAYVAHDLIAEVDRSFPTVPEPSARAVGGNSMGAHGALQIAMNFPRVFGAVGAHSPTLRPFETAPRYFGDRAEFERRDPASIIDARPDAAKALQLAIDVGRDDSWRPRVEELHEHLVARGIPHQFDVLPGDHSDAYWSGNVERYLRTYDSMLHR